MNHKSLSILIFILFTLKLSGQLFTTQTSTDIHNEKSIDMYSIQLDIDMSDAKEYWNDFMEDENDTDIKGFGLFSKKDLLETDLVVMKSISNVPLKLFVKFEEDNGLTHIKAFLKKEDGTFVSSSAEGDKLTFTNLKRLMNRYLNYFIPLYYQQRLKYAEENLEQAIDLVEDVNDDLEDNKKDIAKNKEKIAELKEEILELNNENEELRHQLKENEKRIIIAREKKEKAQKVIERKKYTYTDMIELLRSLEPK